MPKLAKTVNIKPFRRVLVANRGEIAVRIMRALRELSIESVALYSEVDQESLHVDLADYAVRMGGSSQLADTYLNHAKVVNAALVSDCDGIHPGYGFLSENVEFVELVERTAGLRFIGPTSQAMAQLGDKVKAKAIFKQQGVPVLPGSAAVINNVAELELMAEQIGYPLVLKAAAGGGGRGMRVVTDATELHRAYAEATREAMNCFGVKDVFGEKYLSRPRHIEFQTIFDAYGAGIHLFERDCSLQRRYQKILEEAPAVGLAAELRHQMGALAVAAGISVQYCGVATVEFICDGDDFYFMEMNTRIQVEHPVTEMITGVDLLKASIKMAEGRRLELQQEELKVHGHAIEVRINAEDPARNFAPSLGKVQTLNLPGGPGVRVDTHLRSGYHLPDLFDSLLAKVIVWGRDRAEAIARLLSALRELEIKPLKTTQAFHEVLLTHEAFLAGQVFTTFLTHHQADLHKRLLSGMISPVNESKEIPALSEFEVQIIGAVLAEQRYQHHNQRHNHDMKTHSAQHSAKPYSSTPAEQVECWSPVKRL